MSSPLIISRNIRKFNVENMAEDMAQFIKCFAWKNLDMDLIPSSHIKNHKIGHTYNPLAIEVGESLELANQSM